MPTTTTNLRTGTRRDGNHYVGVIRQGRTIVAECGHLHQHRDFNTYDDTAARQCINDIVKASRDNAFAAELIDKTRSRWNQHRTLAVTAATAQRWKTEDAADADKLAALIDTVRGLNIDTGTATRPTSEPTVEEIGDPTDPAYAWMFQ
jgi:hypothetical protein